MRATILVSLILLMTACAGNDVAVPEECVGVYKLPIEKKTYLVKPGGGSAPEHCRDYAISLEEHLEKKPLPAGYVNCRTGEGTIVGMKPETCTREGGASLD